MILLAILFGILGVFCIGMTYRDNGHVMFYEKEVIKYLGIMCLCVAFMFIGMKMQGNRNIKVLKDFGVVQHNPKSGGIEATDEVSRESGLNYILFWTNTQIDGYPYEKR